MRKMIQWNFVHQNNSWSFWEPEPEEVAAICTSLLVEQEFEVSK